MSALAPKADILWPLSYRITTDNRYFSEATLCAWFRAGSFSGDAA
jgi:hypothetical protein